METDREGNIPALKLEQGDDVQEEYEMETRRIHTLICPDCSKERTKKLGIPEPESRLAIPYFAMIEERADQDSGPQSGPPTHSRWQPPDLTRDELQSVIDKLALTARVRRQSSDVAWIVRVDGEEVGRLDNNQQVALTVADDVNQVAIERPDGVPLGVYLIGEAVQQKVILVPGNRHELVFTVTPEEKDGDVCLHFLIERRHFSYLRAWSGRSVAEWMPDGNRLVPLVALCVLVIVLGLQWPHREDDPSQTVNPLLEGEDRTRGSTIEQRIVSKNQIKMVHLALTNDPFFDALRNGLQQKCEDLGWQLTDDPAVADAVFKDLSHLQDTADPKTFYLVLANRGGEILWSHRGLRDSHQLGAITLQLDDAFRQE